MATVVLGAIGTSLGGPLGGFIGSSIGSLIDNQFLLPLLGGNQTIEAPKIDDLNLTLAKEGSPVPFVLGPAVRVGGLISWKSDLEIVTTSSGGGGGKGGGGGVEVEKKTVFTDFRVHATETTDNGIFDITKVYANDKVIYKTDIPPDPPLYQDVVSDKIGVRPTGYAYAVTPFVQYGQTLEYRSSGKCRIICWDPAIDLDGYFVENQKISISNFSYTPLNGRRAIVQGTGSGTGIHPTTLVADSPYTYIEVRMLFNMYYPEGSSSGEPAWEENLEGTITITLEEDAIPKSYFDDLIPYLGGNSQITPDGLMEEIEGAGNVPGFINMAGFVVDRLDLTDFGNGTPRFNALIAERESLTDGEAIEVLLSRTGLPDTLYDASACTNEMLGINSSGIYAPGRLIEMIALAKDLIVFESEGVYTFKPRTTTIDGSVPNADLGAGQPGTSRTRSITRNRKPSRKLFDEVTVSFYDPEREYQTGSRSERKVTSQKREAKTIDFPFTMNNQEAGNIADRVLWQQWTDRFTVQFSLGPKHIDKRPGDLINITDDSGEVVAVRIASINIGINFVMQCTGVIEDNLSLSPVATEDGSGTGGDGDIDLIFDMQPYTWNGPALDEAQLNITGFYVSLTNLVLTSPFRTSILFADKNSTGTFTSTGVVIEDEGIAGRTIDPAPIGPIGQWDNGTMITVDLTNGMLASATREEVLAGANRAMLGDELIAFTTVDSFGFGQYRISGLLRGLRDTETEMIAQDGVDDLRFVLLGSTTVGFYEQPTSANGASYEFKGVPSGQDEANFETTLTDLHTLRTLRPFSVTNIRGSRSGSDLTITWDRRSRGFWPLFTEGGMPRWDPDEVYLVEELDGPDGTVLDTTTVTDATTLEVVSAANPYYARISRVSLAYNGSGPKKEATL